MTRKVICVDWDSDVPEKLRDAQTGELIGVLVPRTSQAILDASPAVQSWSKSNTKGRYNVEMYDPDSVVKFAEHWERVHRETYPLAADTRTYVERVRAGEFTKPETKLEADARKARNYDFSGD